jgi:hypothetical protein
MSLDSVAVFLERVAELGLSVHRDNFAQQGWTTYAKLASATSYVPGALDETVFVREIVAVGLGREDHPDKGVLRRLFFEAYTLAAADLKHRVEVRTDDAPRRCRTWSGRRGAQGSPHV